MSEAAPPATAAPRAPPARAPITSDLATDYAACQDRRRRDALDRQRARRAERVAEARASASAAPSAEQQQQQQQQQWHTQNTEQYLQQVEAETRTAIAQAGGEEEALDAALAATAEAVDAAEEDPSGLWSADMESMREMLSQAAELTVPSASRGLHQQHASQMMVYDWLAASSLLPPDLGPRSWLVLPRPGGVRCLVTSGGGNTVARVARTGRLLMLPMLGGSTGAASIPTQLPGGSRRTMAGPAAHCTLDCVLLPLTPQQQRQQQQYQQRRRPLLQQSLEESEEARRAFPPRFVVLDVLEWRGVDLAGCSADARMGWLASKAAEGEEESGMLPPRRFADERAAEAAAAGGEPVAVRARFALAGAAPATTEAVAEAAGGGAAAAHGWPEQEGVLFLHAEGDYAAGGAAGTPSPLALAWKDARSAAYVVDTPVANGGAAAAEAEQMAVLRLVPSSSAASAPSSSSFPPSAATLDAVTADDPPHVLVRGIPERPDQRARANALHKFSVVPTAGEAQASFATDNVAPSLLLLPGPAAATVALVHKGPAGASRMHADGMSKVVFQSMARRGALPGLDEILAVVGRNEAVEEQGGGGDAEMANG